MLYIYTYVCYGCSVTVATQITQSKTKFIVTHCLRNEVAIANVSTVGTRAKQTMHMIHDRPILTKPQHA